ncbi:MAG: hypothetical protein JRJ41_07940 [Deltaproteobacteria bacterium]|nr:hypothetical protein [Deltaproteobacteria bacterium]
MKRNLLGWRERNLFQKFLRKIAYEIFKESEVKDDEHRRGNEKLWIQYRGKLRRHSVVYEVDKIQRKTRLCLHHRHKWEMLAPDIE